MKVHIIQVQSPVLKSYIQYFIFFKHTDTNLFTYTTFPNTNLCLAVYKQNNVVFANSRDSNSCRVDEGTSEFHSRLIGFHQRPFNVEINSHLEQFCIIFQPGGLRAFTKIPYEDLINENRVFEILFNNKYIIEHVFETDSANEKALLLENLLLARMTAPSVDSRLSTAVASIYSSNGDVTVAGLAAGMKVDTSTLYRQFNKHIGQTPKDFIQTVRFRHVLSNMLEGQYTNFSQLCYLSNFHDQSHFIHEIKKRSGNVPQQLSRQISVEQRQLVWITDSR